ncbi:MAG TPA: AAA family ATPase [Steroidobacteraceae bacterium]|nr:AAA family ATPase [Steroidobacteraceae bacterium]
MHLLERQKQLEELNRCFNEARAGSGKLVLIGAEAGVGKSALVERFVAERRREARALWGACDGLSTPPPLAPVHEIAAQTRLQHGRAAREEESRERLFRMLLDDFAQPEPCVVVLEDLHWADAATLDFVRFVGRRIQRTHAVFVATYRDDELSANHPARIALGELTGHHVLRMRLAPLSPAGVGVLTADSGRDPALIHRITGGNPFFVREVLASPGELVPPTVRDAVMARLARCLPATCELAEFVAISPGRTERWLIETVLGARQAAVDEAGARGLLDVQTDSVGFRHELARLAVLGSMSGERARTLHAQILPALVEHRCGAARLVHHAALAEESALVLEHAPRAAHEAALQGAHREAAAHLDAALHHGGALPPVRRAELLEQHARESSLANQARAAIASAGAALGLWRESGDTQAQARVLCLLSQEYRTVGEKARADECVSGAISVLEGLPRSCDLAMAYSWRSLLAVHRGFDREALEFGQRALELARALGDRAAESHALCNIGGAMLGSGDRGGFEPLERSLALARAGGLEDHAARTYRTLLFYTVLIHDFARAQQAFEEGVEFCEERGIFSHSAYIRAYYTACALDRGDWEEAARTASELLRSSEFTGVHQRVTILATLALVRLRRGDPGATALLDEAVTLALPTGELNRIGRVAAARAELAWYEGRLDDVAQESARGLLHVSGHRAPWIHGELLFWQSRVQPGVSASGEVAEPYRLMLSGDWRAAARCWEHIGMPYEQALALAEGPEEDLLEALAILDRLGGGPLGAIVRRRLRERGVRGVPRGPNLTTRANPSGLTAKELQVLQLLAQGCTNAQLARRLHRSPKTIDHHVGALLGKLGVRSRTEAVAAAFGRGIIAAPDPAPAPGHPGRER